MKILRRDDVLSHLNYIVLLKIEKEREGERELSDWARRVDDASRGKRTDSIHRIWPYQDSQLGYIIALVRVTL